jgi:hypothetical protein
MKKDDRDTLEILRAELDFVEKGGYCRSVKTPWQPTSIFQDSPICLNFADAERPHPCNECLLIDFVPAADRTQDVPCHFIPLDSSGATIDELEWKENQRETAEAVKTWLKASIERLEADKSSGAHA